MVLRELPQKVRGLVTEFVFYFTVSVLVAQAALIALIPAIVVGGIFVGAIVLLSGCAVPEGLQHQASGIQISPFGDAPQAPKVTAGMYSFSLPDPPDSGPVINRTQIRGFGLNHNQTTTHGPIGDQIQSAAGIPENYQKVDTLERVMQALHGQGGLRAE